MTLWDTNGEEDINIGDVLIQEGLAKSKRSPDDQVSKTDYTEVNNSTDGQNTSSVTHKIYSNQDSNSVTSVQADTNVRYPKHKDNKHQDVTLQCQPVLPSLNNHVHEGEAARQPTILDCKFAAADSPTAPVDSSICNPLNDVVGSHMNLIQKTFMNLGINRQNVTPSSVESETSKQAKSSSLSHEAAATLKDSFCNFIDSVLNQIGSPVKKFIESDTGSPQTVFTQSHNESPQKNQTQIPSKKEVLHKNIPTTDLIQRAEVPPPPSFEAFYNHLHVKPPPGFGPLPVAHHQQIYSSSTNYIQPFDDLCRDESVSLNAKFAPVLSHMDECVPSFQSFTHCHSEMIPSPAFASMHNKQSSPNISQCLPRLPQALTLPHTPANNEEETFYSDKYVMLLQHSQFPLDETP